MKAPKSRNHQSSWNEAQLKDLFDKVNQLTINKEAIQNQIKAVDEEQRGSEIDVDSMDQGLGSDPPDFAQTREDNTPVDDSNKNSTLRATRIYVQLIHSI